MKKKTGYRLEKIQLQVRQNVSAQLAESLTADQYDELMADSVVHAFRAELYGSYEPATWVDGLKEKLNRRFGWDLRVRRVTNVCPHLVGGIDLHVAFAGRPDPS